LSEYALEPWAEDDLPLLERLLGDPAMTEHLGGPESAEKLAERHEKYLGLRGESPDKAFKIVDVATGEGVGFVGYWERDLPGEQVYETGWSVLPEFQGRGIATIATAQAIELARAERRHRSMWAYPAVDNEPSNAICRKLGFELVDTEEFEYPPGSGKIMRCNNWRLDLFADS
jgi:RimJ/RimL family protein N-acetyltransferase